MARLKISALPEAGFYRAGQFWPHDGRIVEADDLDAATLDRLRAEPRLRVEEVAADGAGADPSPRELRAMIAATFEHLNPEADFTESGVPRVASVRRLLPEGAPRIGADLVAEVWAETADRREAPADPQD